MGAWALVAVLGLAAWWELGLCEEHEEPGVWPGQADFIISC